MLDARASILLEKINEICGDGGYKIAEEDELLSCFPPEAGVGGEALRSLLAALAEEKYIDVGYAEEGVYCISPRPEGKTYFERVRRQRGESGRRRREILLFAGLGGGLGGLLGGLLAGLLLFAAGAL